MWLYNRINIGHKSPDKTALYQEVAYHKFPDKCHAILNSAVSDIITNITVNKSQWGILVTRVGINGTS